MGGEVGEFQNEIKKMFRHRLGVAGGKNDPEAVADELADVVICCSIVANQLGLRLSEIVARKFNKTSAKHNLPVINKYE